jgi:Fe-S-cluster-containing dehydrogenase component
MKKWNMIIDVAECTNCQLCALSAMDEYVGNMWPGVAAPMPRHGHQWIDIKQKERGQAPMIDIAYVPTMCNHCDNAPCLAKGGDAVKKRPTASSSSTRTRPRAAKTWSKAAPTVTSGGTRNCSFRRSGRSMRTCSIRAGSRPAASKACPTGAMRAIKVEDDEMERMARDESLEVMKPEAGTKPRVYYRNLWRYSKSFIGGSVAT